jgi:Asp-tRNA(Asn)/Glu-tRNA(Gln) amidotransferase A subunit family amidase
LHGIPFAAKDIFYTESLPTEAGSKLYRNFIPGYSATAVTRLKEAGAVLLGKTQTTELANLDPTPTRNPWNLGHTPGGSSSGSAAAVAARMVPVALGSQTGGSALRQTSYCGAVGDEDGTVSGPGTKKVQATGTRAVNPSADFAISRAKDGWLTTRRAPFRASL